MKPKKPLPTSVLQPWDKSRAQMRAKQRDQTASPGKLSKALLDQPRILTALRYLDLVIDMGIWWPQLSLKYPMPIGLRKGAPATLPNIIVAMDREGMTPTEIADWLEKELAL